MGFVERVVRYIVLPPEITRFERDHLTRMNRIALWFFVFHVPVFGAVAFANGSGVGAAVLLTTMGIAGPAIAMKVLDRPRAVSLLFGVAAMYMGALLVHFGRGLWTIEMHFYFFVALALLAVFANPAVILVAAATVTLHHLALWFIAPASVFNYDAPVSSVLVHALFVVVESVAACFVARSFFDNVIGLESIVAERTRALDQKNHDMRLVFDNVNQGFLTVTLDGRLNDERSAVVDSWLGAPEAGQTLWAFLGRTNSDFGCWVELGWAQLMDRLLPAEVALAQLPQRLTAGGRELEVSWQPLSDEGALSRVLLVISDVTDSRKRERADIAQRETLDVFERLLRDRAGFLEFFAEARFQAGRLAASPCALSQVELRRTIHTIKGTSAQFGVASVALACDRVEGEIAENSNEVTETHRQAVVSAWGESSARILKFLDGDRKVIELDEVDYLAIMHAINEGAPRLDVLRMIQSWKHEPVRKQLERFSDQARSLARRLGKGEIEVDIEHHHLRLPREELAPLFGAMVHLVRNAVDHGLRPPAPGAAPGRLTFSCAVRGDQLVLAVKDDGTGVAWEEVRRIARTKGLPAESKADLEEALFVDGLTTSQVVSDVSGRGAGMGAVQGATAALGGTVTVSSEEGRGTCVSIALPLSSLRAQPLTRAPATLPSSALDA